MIQGMRNSNGLNGMRERALLRYLVVRDVYALHMVPKRNTRCSGTYIRIPIPWRHQLESQLKSVFFCYTTTCAAWPCTFYIFGILTFSGVLFSFVEAKDCSGFCAKATRAAS